MTIEETIKKAIEGGWKPKGQNFSLDETSYKVQALNKVKYKERFFLDPKFWQALGRAMGWTNTDKVKIWKYNWHCFIDHLAEGKSIESFFQNL